MIKVLTIVTEFHGKKYYTAFDDEDMAKEAMNLLKTDDKYEALRNESFHITKIDNKFVVYSDAKLESFRGKKHIAWEKFKVTCYKLKKGL